MSRSIHETRRSLKEASRNFHKDEWKTREDLRKIRYQLNRKRMIKREIKAERQAETIAPPATDPELIPLLIDEEIPQVHYPAGVDDIRNLMRRLPKGSLDGLVEIRFSLGFEDCENSEDKDWFDRDPYTGRFGWEALPGVFWGAIQGMYLINRAIIKLYGCVYESSLPDREMWEIYLRLNVLSVFVHEVAHHHDAANRTARGRWLKDITEYYAEELERKWNQDYVVPYLEETYPEGIKRLLQWVKAHCGVALELGALARRPPVSGDMTIHSAIGEIAHEVAKGENTVSTSLRFAEFIHDLHEEKGIEPGGLSMQIADRIISEQKDHYEALALRGHILGTHRDGLDEAKEILEYLLTRRRDDVRVIWDLSLILEEKELWSHLEACATQGIQFESRPFVRKRLLYLRARARLGRGNYYGALDDFCIAIDENRRFLKSLGRIVGPPDFLLVEFSEMLHLDIRDYVTYSAPNVSMSDLIPLGHSRKGHRPW